ncbi:MAG: hypothetical protein V2A73_05985 [Pseudomonadota bacterium]
MLDTASSLPAGSGRLDLLAFADPKRLGGGLQYQAKIRPGLSAMATGWVGAERGSASDGWEQSYGINAGLRWEW